MNLDKRSLASLRGVHPDLVAIAAESESIAGDGVEVCIIEGLRSMETQMRYLKSGASKTTNSRHLSGHAFDFAVKIDGKLQDRIHPYYQKQADFFKATAKRLGHPITWGGDWGWDGMHVELDWKAYPLKEKPKTPGNSTTIAASIGGMATTVIPEVVAKATNVTESIEALGVKKEWMIWVQIVVVVGLFAFIVNERRKKIDREGV